MSSAQALPCTLSWAKSIMASWAAREEPHTEVDREGCQYSDPSRDGLVLVDETAQEVVALELHRGSVE